jgi:hypothetical protein
LDFASDSRSKVQGSGVPHSAVHGNSRENAGIAETAASNGRPTSGRNEPPLPYEYGRWKLKWDRTALLEMLIALEILLIEATKPFLVSSSAKRMVLTSSH